MTGPIIKIIVRLFSIYSNIDPDNEPSAGKPILQSYLSHYLKDSFLEEHLSIFDFYNTQFSYKNTKDFYKRISLHSVKTLDIINQINKTLVYSDKIFLLTHLIEILKTKETIIHDEYDFLLTIALSFNIPDDEFEDLKSYILTSCHDIRRKERILKVVNSNTQASSNESKVLMRNNLNGELCFLHLPSANLFLFYYQGNETLFLNGKQIEEGKIYKFTKGSSISSYKMGLQNIKIKPIYYTELAKEFIGKKTPDHVELVIDNIQFQYNSNHPGIQPFRFKTESFLFVGIVGSSGVGKSTLLNIINGNLKPQQGSVKLNGFDIHKNKKYLKGLIGYVPQEDLLFEELTVYENLYYNAQLCFGNYTKDQIHQSVINILQELDIENIKNSKVGSPLDKEISGGQRKRINLGLELLREPSILLVDEPTSGLSSSDSINIINLLREQTQKGKLVIVNIHQPSSNVFKLFDQLIVLDNGGTPVYSGDPMESLVYFKTLNEQVNAQEKECPTCGTINPEIMLEIIEDKEIDEEGSYTGKRKRNPEAWYQLYKENIEKDVNIAHRNTQLPANQFKRPNLFNQFKIFTFRNLKTKITNKQYLLISLLEAPLLALILGFFTKYTVGTADNEYAYIFSKNVNLPSYLLMSIIVAMFIGMLISAEEIFKDRKVLEREKFLNLSRSSYLLSKIALLFSLSAIQMLTFVIIGNWILEIRDLNIEYWLVLFSVAFFSNLLGLNISSGLKSQIAIYILIPFLLIPQILLSGTIIKFDKLHGKLTSELYPPVIADLMVSRWSYEALAVKQFKDNEYEQALYDIKRSESDYYYKTNILIPELIHYTESSINLLNQDTLNSPKLEDALTLLNNELHMLKNTSSEHINIDFSALSNEKINQDILKNIKISLNELRKKYARKLDAVLYSKDEIINKKIKNLGGIENFNDFKNNNHNYSIAELVKRKDNPVKIINKKNQLFRKFEPIFLTPRLSYGRTQFFVPEKKLGGYFIDTFTFNLIVIWIFNGLLYIILYYDLLRKAIKKTRRNEK
jgi:ABC-type multidrug transport system ATPase subunit